MTITQILALYLNPVGLLTGAVVVFLTVYLAERLAHKRARFRSGFLEAFAQASKNSEYEGTAGLRLPDYFDGDDLLLTKVDLLDEVCGRIGEKLSHYPDAKPCFIEKDSGPVGALSIAGYMVSKLRRPVSIVRPNRDVWKMRIEGAPIEKGNKVVLVQDLLTRAFQVIRAVRVLEEVGARVIAVVALVDREEDKDPEFTAKGIETTCILKLSEIREYVKETSKKPAEQNIMSAGN